MKKINHIARNLMVGGIALATALAVSRAAAENVHQVVQVVRVEGNVQYSTAGQPFMTAHEGDIYEAGTIIRTAQDSHVDIMLGDESTAKNSIALQRVATESSGPAGGGGGGGGGLGNEEATANMVRIFQMTVLSVDKLMVERTGNDEVSDTQLDLRVGQIMSNTKKLSAQSHYEIKIPNGVAGIRGNCNVLSSTSKCASIIGTVMEVLVQPDNTTVSHEITAKHMYDPGTGRVIDISDKDYDEYVKLYNDLCRRQPHRPPHHEHDPTKDHDSNLNGTGHHD